MAIPVLYDPPDAEVHWTLLAQKSWHDETPVDAGDALAYYVFHPRLHPSDPTPMLRFCDITPPTDLDLSFAIVHVAVGGSLNLLRVEGTLGALDLHPYPPSGTGMEASKPSHLRAMPVLVAPNSACVVVHRSLPEGGGIPRPFPKRFGVVVKPFALTSPYSERL